MSWEVTAKVSGGCKYSTEETEAYMRAAKALSHQADALSRAHDSVRALSLQLSSYPYASSAIASLSGSSPYCNATDHIELPYDHSSNNVTPMQARWEPWRQDCLSYRR